MGDIKQVLCKRCLHTRNYDDLKNAHVKGIDNCEIKMCNHKDEKTKKTCKSKVFYIP